MTTSALERPAEVSTRLSTWHDRALDFAERGIVPDSVIRAAIRRFCGHRLREIAGSDEAERHATVRKFAALMDAGPIALVPEAANQQHYELPPAFFEHVLGVHRKYSACLWDGHVQSLNDAEARSLRLTCERARVDNGMSILELGCGWGSLTLWMAKAYPGSTITAVSNSGPQRAFIESEMQRHGLANVRVVTADMNEFEPLSPVGGFDRVVSVEMFEHMRNWRRLLQRIARWMKPNGLMFMHIFCHRSTPYVFETEGAGNWMGRHFFTGGMMPSFDLLDACTDDMRVEKKHWIDGTHYAKTAEAWLANVDAQRSAIMPIMRETCGSHDARRWFQRWRMFFMACAELFAYRSGSEWGVGHFILARSAHPH